MMPKQPVYVFTRFFKNEMELFNVLNRLDYYGAAYLMKVESSSQKLVVVLNLDKKQDFEIIRQSFKNLEFITLQRKGLALPFLFVDAIRQLKRSGISPSVLISGDPYISGFLVYLLKQFRFRKSIVQFQVHGHPFQYFNFFSIKRSVLRFLYSFNLNHADSIRLVSKSQLEYNFLRSQVNHDKIFIAPIPIMDLNMNTPEERNKEGLLFLGRFHQERNLDLWLEIAENIAFNFPEFSISMAGSGPLMEFVKNYKGTHQSLMNLELLGEIPRSSIEKVLHAHTILLSTAEHESYGLSLREALLSGLFVVAKGNPTTKLLERDFPNLVRTFTSGTQAADIISGLIGCEAPKNEITRVRLQQSLINHQSVNSLVQSWITSH